MQGFASELLGEVFTKGKGPFGQIGVPLGQPLNSEYAGVALAVWVRTWSCQLPNADHLFRPDLACAIFQYTCVAMLGQQVVSFHLHYGPVDTFHLALCQGLCHYV